MNGYFFTLCFIIIILLMGLFGMALDGNPLALVTLAAIGTVAVMLVAFGIALAFESRSARAFRTNAAENQALMQAQARGLAELALAQQRQMRALGQGISVESPPSMPQFGLAPGALVGFGDDDEVDLLGDGRAPMWDTGG